VRILVVEDESRIARFLQRGLSARGYEVESVGRGGDALERFPHANLVILDLGLPDLDGVEVLQRLRDRDQDVPVIVLTARADIEDRVQALTLGADDYLVKPVAFDELAARVEASFRRVSPGGLSNRRCGHRVLIVEDSARIASLVARGLEGAGMEVIVAEDGDVGGLLAATEQFDVVILDLGLPGTSGLELLRSVRAERPELPIILLTGRDEPEIRTEAIAAGATDYVTKPFGVDDLQRRVLASLSAEAS
jgi:DNA-binding response OmpR family regulator